MWTHELGRDACVRYYKSVSQDQRGPLVHTSRPLLRPHLPYVQTKFVLTLCKVGVDPAAHEP